ncbi:hypothetical protein GMORB2_0194 [Geosmithia morbida]|uniref:Uncharacterized protein n=1 Tax=Geosmithia morbida TaxID=1094350 RepID=A0A9P4Z0I5_9HYPO|nr:uncharacterized protein GMORB2_0194 [Geosmithia morbida]KAF4126458.1 hypothetical protein GMORB2_0194 [Geosmithia morbida]
MTLRANVSRLLPLGSAAAALRQPELGCVAYCQTGWTHADTPVPSGSFSAVGATATGFITTAKLGGASSSASSASRDCGGSSGWGDGLSDRLSAPAAVSLQILLQAHFPGSSTRSCALPPLCPSIVSLLDSEGPSIVKIINNLTHANIAQKVHHNHRNRRNHHRLDG